MPLQVSGSSAEQTQGANQQLQKPNNRNLTPAERLGRLREIFGNLSGPERAAFLQEFNREFLPYMISELPLEDIEQIKVLAKRQLPPKPSKAERRPDATPSKINFQWAVPCNPERYKFKRPLAEETYSDHYREIERLNSELNGLKARLLANTQNSGSHADIIGTALANTMIASGGANAIKGFKHEFNAALDLLLNLKQLSILIDIQLNNVREFVNSYLKTIARYKIEFDKSSYNTAVQQNNLKVELEKEGSISAYLPAIVASGVYKNVPGDFPYLKEEPNTQKPSFDVNIQRFTSCFNEIEQFLNQLHQFQLQMTMSQLGFSNGPRHLVEVLPEYQHDPDFQSVLSQSNASQSQVFVEMKAHKETLCKHEAYVLAAQTMLEEELLKIKNGYDQLGESLIKVFNVYRTSIETLAKNMKSPEIIQEFNDKAKKYE